MSADDSRSQLATELESIVERLGDLAMDLLRDGLQDGSEEAALQATKQEKLVNRARGAVVKAASILQRLRAETADQDGTGD
ncbi:MAG: hypothetical protein ACRD0Z_17765 [Acidimicrobiales bacterium]